jgi:hypothetical protein
MHFDFNFLLSEKLIYKESGLIIVYYFSRGTIPDSAFADVKSEDRDRLFIREKLIERIRVYTEADASFKAIRKSIH